MMLVCLTVTFYLCCLSYNFLNFKIVDAFTLQNLVYQVGGCK